VPECALRWRAHRITYAGFYSPDILQLKYKKPCMTSRIIQPLMSGVKIFIISVLCAQFMDCCFAQEIAGLKFPLQRTFTSAALIDNNAATTLYNK
jgi:hypothetical protein